MKQQTIGDSFEYWMGTVGCINALIAEFNTSFGKFSKCNNSDLVVVKSPSKSAKVLHISNCIAYYFASKAKGFWHGKYFNSTNLCSFDGVNPFIDIKNSNTLINDDTPNPLNIISKLRSDSPKGILVIGKVRKYANYSMFIDILNSLRDYGYDDNFISKFKVILWNIEGKEPAIEEINSQFIFINGYNTDILSYIISGVCK